MLELFVPLKIYLFIFDIIVPVLAILDNVPDIQFQNLHVHRYQQ